MMKKSQLLFHFDEPKQKELLPAFALLALYVTGGPNSLKCGLGRGTVQHKSP